MNQVKSERSEENEKIFSRRSLSKRTVSTRTSKFPGHEPDRFLENSSNTEHLVEINILRMSVRDIERFLENSSRKFNRVTTK